MKRFLIYTILVLLALFVSYEAAGQITMMAGKKIEEKELVVPYDSLSNIKQIKSGEWYGYKHLIGQKILLVNPEDRIRDFYRLEGDRRIKIPATSMTGKYFTIVDIKQRDPSYQLRDPFYLKMDGDSTTVYLTWGDWDDNKRWVIVGYYEKMRQLYEGKDLVFMRDDDSYMDYDGLINSETRKRTRDIKKGTVWHCSQVSVFPDNDPFLKLKGNRVVLILDNAQYGQHYTFLENDAIVYSSYDDNYTKYLLGKFMIKEDYAKVQAARKAAETRAQEAKAQRRENLIAKYGKDLGAIIADGKVRIGMSKEQCRDAWGNPSDINKTTNAYGTHEQWVYPGGNYLYFDNHTLTTIQN